MTEETNLGFILPLTQPGQDERVREEVEVARRALTVALGSISLLHGMIPDSRAIRGLLTLAIAKLPKRGDS